MPAAQELFFELSRVAGRRLAAPCLTDIGPGSVVSRALAFGGWKLPLGIRRRAARADSNPHHPRGGDLGVGGLERLGRFIRGVTGDNQLIERTQEV